MGKMYERNTRFSGSPCIITYHLEYLIFVSLQLLILCENVHNKNGDRYARSGANIFRVVSIGSFLHKTQ